MNQNRNKPKRIEICKNKKSYAGKRMILSEYKKHRNAKLDSRLLWDVDLKQFDFQKGKYAVIERVVEMGALQDWYAVLNLYGLDVVQQEIKKIDLLLDRDLFFVHNFLNIPFEEMKSYQNKLAGKKHWRE